MKKLLIIGNKIINKHFPTEEYDFIARYNKIDNSEYTGIKCDLYGAFFAYDDFVQKISSEKLELIKNYNNFISFGYVHKSWKKKIEKLLGSNYSKSNVEMDYKPLISYFNLDVSEEIFHKFQSMTKYILYAIYTFSNEYEIYATAFDLDRDYLKTDPYHVYYDKEYEILKKLKDENRFNYV